MVVDVILENYTYLYNKSFQFSDYESSIKSKGW